MEHCPRCFRGGSNRLNSIIINHLLILPLYYSNLRPIIRCKCNGGFRCLALGYHGNLENNNKSELVAKSYIYNQVMFAKSQSWNCRVTGAVQMISPVLKVNLPRRNLTSARGSNLSATWLDKMQQLGPTCYPTLRFGIMLML